MASYGDLQFVTTNNQPSVRGLEWPVRITNTGGMFSENINENAVKDGLIQLLLTQQGERPMRLDYGTFLRTAVFGPLDAETISDLENTIKAAIGKYEPRVLIRNLSIAPSTDQSQLDLNLVFSMKDNVFSTDGIFLTVTAEDLQP